MINRKDYDFIKERFDGDGLKAPDSLSAENIMQKLDSAPQPSKKTIPKKRWFRPAVSIAACVSLAIGIVPFVRSSGGPDAEGIVPFRSYAELSGKMEEMVNEGSQSVFDDGLSSDGTGRFSAKGDGATISENAEIQSGSDRLGSAPGAAESAGENPESHSETYAQVEGVDEADIVKTDGNYIYYSSYVENQVIIARAKNGKTDRVGAINAGKVGEYIREMYVKDGRLTVIGEDNGGFGKVDREYTTVSVFDVTEPSRPKQLTRYSQTGALLSSRMIDSNICLVTNDYIHTYNRSTCIPYVCCDGKDPVCLDIDNICGISEAVDPAYTVIGCIDTATGKADKDKIKTKAILGGSSEIYCNSRNLYVAADVSERTMKGDFCSYDDRTCILKVSIKDGSVKYKKTAIIDGNLNNQFSMDESGGYFKIAVTDRENGQDTNDLYIMDKNMKEVGSVRNFAPGEHIEAVRYIKNKAYVITYQQTDPLFIIDLTDPEAPVIEGHVKITGFSTLLVPSGKDRLLGLGFSTESTEVGEATSGVKLSLFDISDPSDPAVADFREYEDMYSEVQYNHKALLVGPKESYYAIPFERWDDPGDDNDQGVLKFSVKAGKLTDFHTIRTKEAVKRCIYIGKYIYCICGDDSIEGSRAQ